MSDQGIVVVGIPIPSSSPVFLALVGIHVVAGLTCVITGLVAMLSAKRVGRHPSAGTIYYRSLVVVFVTMAALSVMRWPNNVHLFILGILSFASGWIGRTARRRLWAGWPRVHIAGMGSSYILLLTAFYVDNGPHLPIWQRLPPIAFWVGPSLIGLPIILWALLRHPVVGSSHPES
jgi:hypothetical protein